MKLRRNKKHKNFKVSYKHGNKVQKEKFPEKAELILKIEVLLLFSVSKLEKRGSFSFNLWRGYRIWIWDLLELKFFFQDLSVKKENLNLLNWNGRISYLSLKWNEKLLVEKTDFISGEEQLKS